MIEAVSSTLPLLGFRQGGMLGGKNEENWFPQPPAKVFPQIAVFIAVFTQGGKRESQGNKRISLTRKPALGGICHEANGKMGLGVLEVYWGMEQKKRREPLGHGACVIPVQGEKVQDGE